MTTLTKPRVPTGDLKRNVLDSPDSGIVWVVPWPFPASGCSLAFSVRLEEPKWSSWRMTTWGSLQCMKRGIAKVLQQA